MTYKFDKLKKLIKPFEEGEEWVYPEDPTAMTEEEMDAPQVTKPITVNLNNIKVTKPVQGKAEIIPIPPTQEYSIDPFEKGIRDTELSYNQPKMSYKQRALKNLAYRIGKLESSSGANIDHPIITDPKSMHYGTAGIGTHAMMPKTIYDVINRISKNDPSYDELRKLYTPTSDEYEYNFDQDELKQYLLHKRPDILEKAHNDLLNYTLQIQRGNPEKAAVAWEVGTDASPREIDRILQSKGPRGNSARQRLSRYKAIADQMDPSVLNEITPSASPDSTFNTNTGKLLDLGGMNYGPLQKLNPLQKGRLAELLSKMNQKKGK